MGLDADHLRPVLRRPHRHCRLPVGPCGEHGRLRPGRAKARCLHHRPERRCFQRQRLDHAGVAGAGFRRRSHAPLDRGRSRGGPLAGLDHHGQAAPAIHHRGRGCADHPGVLGETLRGHHRDVARPGRRDQPLFHNALRLLRAYRGRHAPRGGLRPGAHRGGPQHGDPHHPARPAVLHVRGVCRRFPDRCLPGPPNAGRVRHHRPDPHADHCQSLPGSREGRSRVLEPAHGRSRRRTGLDDLRVRPRLGTGRLRSPQAPGAVHGHKGRAPDSSEHLRKRGLGRASCSRSGC